MILDEKALPGSFELLLDVIYAEVFWNLVWRLASDHKLPGII